jgi:hypothetical protein
MDPSGGGWEVRLPVLVGYGYFDIPNRGCDAQRSQRAHALDLAIGADVTGWSTGRLGFDLRVIAFAGPTFLSTGEAYGPPTSAYAAHFGYGGVVTIGVAVGPM